MGQHYQPNFDKMIQGQSIQTTDEDIMADVRKLMMAEEVEHPAVVKTPKRRAQPQVIKQAVAQKVSPAVKVARKAKGYQPRWSHNLLILSLAVLIYSPLGVVSSVALIVAGGLAVFWLVGAARLSAVGRVVFGLLHRVSPAQADRLVGWANRLSDRMQSLVNRLPTRWTQGLYMPSFSNEAEAELDHVEPFDRLVAQRRGGAETTTR